MRAPDGLGPAGRKVWRDTLRAVAPGWQLDEVDLLVLGQAARQADLVAELDRAVRAHGVMIEGAAGQARLNGAVTAVNTARGVLARLLAQVEIAPPAPKTGHLNSRQRSQLRSAQQEAGRG